MVKVPEYQQTERLRPIFQSELTVRANADQMGAAVGRGMTQAAQGLSNLGDSVRAVQELEDTMRAKDADNQYSNWLRERMYGEGGFMTLAGRNAVDARKAFDDEAEAKRKEFGSSLTGGAARSYQSASQARLQSVHQQSIVHSAQERKTWFKDASIARVETFSNDALVNYANPALAAKNIAAGIMELRERGQMDGWDADTLKLSESEFVSGTHKNIALRLAQDDPLKADKYIKEKAEQISGKDMYSLRTSLDTEIKNEQSKREADAILSAGRQASASAAPAGSRPVGNTGPSRTRGFLYGKLGGGKGREHVDGLSENFAINLEAMMQDAPPGIREGLGIYSGYRSVDRQRELYAGAVAKYGSPEAARKWVAPPGNSFHNHGQAVDLSYNGQSLQHAPKEVRDWVHANASKYGMYFPMKHEPWHIEPMGTRGTEGGGTVAPRNNTIAPRVAFPSSEEIENRLASISDPDVRDLTRKRIYAQLETQNKLSEANEKAAKAELWKYVDQGVSPDQIPMEVRQAAGMAAVSSAWSYLETAAKGRAVDSDEVLLYDMRRYAASNPTEFAAVDLNDYRDRLSKEAIKELTDKQSSALTDQRKAREDGMNITTAFSQASAQLEAVGLSTTGKDGSKREEAAKRIAMFQNVLAQEMAAFKQANQDRNPNQMEIQSIINKMLLPIVTKQEKSMWNPTKTPWSPTFDQEGFLFEAGQRPDGTTVDVVVKYEDIPIDYRRGIALDLERELGRKPSEDEVVTRYEAYITTR